MDLVLFNTLGRKKEKFTPERGFDVRLYTCGPTVYKSLHIGNYRTYIFEDVLKRVLLINGYRVRHIMNITDVGHLVGDGDEGEDKVEKEARAQRMTVKELARFYEAEFKQDLKDLNVYPPTRFVRATEHIQAQIRLIKTLEKKGFTYRTSDGIYFDSSKLKNYGKLDAANIKGIRSGARVAEKEKHHPTDFALWKFSPHTGPRRQMEWKSPWGVGFPGWHIECSAMSMKYLGPTLDIHCGGADHIQIHHTNEIAQSEAATDKPFARFWMHGAFLTVKGQKMAKSSAENNITIATLRERGFDPLDFRYLTLGTHYRKPLSFGWEALATARTARIKLSTAYKSALSKRASRDEIFKEKIQAAFNNDLNMPKALAILWSGLKSDVSKNAILWSDHIFGLRLQKMAVVTIPAEVKKLIGQREALRKEKRFKEADAIRTKLTALGFRVEDSSSGPVIHRL